MNRKDITRIETNYTNCSRKDAKGQRAQRIKNIWEGYLDLSNTTILSTTSLTIPGLAIPAFRTIIFLSAVKIRVGLIKESTGRLPLIKSEAVRETAKVSFVF
jgi:hypothetical protein